MYRYIGVFTTNGSFRKFQWSNQCVFLKVLIKCLRQNCSIQFSIAAKYHHLLVQEHVDAATNYKLSCSDYRSTCCCAPALPGCKQAGFTSLYPSPISTFCLQYICRCKRNVLKIEWIKYERLKKMEILLFLTFQFHPFFSCRKSWEGKATSSELHDVRRGPTTHHSEKERRVAQGTYTAPWDR